MTSPSSGCAVLVLFHQRGKSGAVLWRAQLSALLYTREGYVLPMSLCRADAPSSAGVSLHASPTHALSPLVRIGPLERMSDDAEEGPLARPSSCEFVLV